MNNIGKNKGTYLVMLLLCIIIVGTILIGYRGINKSKEIENKIALSNDVIEDGNIKIVRQSKFNLFDITYEDDIIEITSGDKEGVFELFESDLKAIYSMDGYKFEGVEGDNIYFVRNFDGVEYEPNKYVIGINNNKLAIYKTDDSGEMILCTDSSEVSTVGIGEIYIENLPHEDVKLIGIGDSNRFQFDTFEQAIEAIRALFYS